MAKLKRLKIAFILAWLQMRIGLFLPRRTVEDSLSTKLITHTRAEASQKPKKGADAPETEPGASGEATSEEEDCGCKH